MVDENSVAILLAAITISSGVIVSLLGTVFFLINRRIESISQRFDNHLDWHITGCNNYPRRNQSAPFPSGDN